MSEKIKLSCPHCGVTGMAPTTLVGQNIKCHGCGESFVARPETSGADEGLTIGDAPTPPPEPAPAPEAPQQPAVRVPVAPQSPIPEPPIAPPAQEKLTVPEPPLIPEPPPSPPTSPEPAPPAGEQSIPTGDASKWVRANRVLAGKVCPACKNEVMLGEQVVQCERCDVVSHANCWDAKNGCSSSRCLSTSTAVAPGSTEACKACAEQIPNDARVCPYCAEPTGASRDGVLPVTFITGKGDFATQQWSFTASSTDLVGKAPGKEEICILRDQANSEITLTSKKMILLIDGKKRKFSLDDIGHMALRSFLGEPVGARTSVVARDALIYSIIGIFCCQIILGPVALVRASRAKEMINLYPESISGRGLATAAQVIGTIDVVLFAIYMLANMINGAGS